MMKNETMPVTQKMTLPVVACARKNDEFRKVLWTGENTQLALMAIPEGDANSYRALFHEAADEGHIVGRMAAADAGRGDLHRRTPLLIVVSSPQVEGVRPAAVRRAGHRYRQGGFLQTGTGAHGADQCRRIAQA